MIDFELRQAVEGEFDKSEVAHHFVGLLIDAAFRNASNARHRAKPEDLARAWEAFAFPLEAMLSGAARVASAMCRRRAVFRKGVAIRKLGRVHEQGRRLHSRRPLQQVKGQVLIIGTQDAAAETNRNDITNCSPVSMWYGPRMAQLVPFPPAAFILAQARFQDLRVARVATEVRAHVRQCMLRDTGPCGGTGDWQNDPFRGQRHGVARIPQA